MHFLDNLAIHVISHPEKIALRVDEDQISYGDLSRLATRVRRALREAGITAGDRVAFYARPDIPVLAAIVGVLQECCVMVTVHHSFSLDKLRVQIEDSGARYVITDQVSGANSVLGRTNIAGILDLNTVKAWLSEEGFSNESSHAPIDADFDGNSIGAIFFTTGSVSKPKGAVVTHRNMIAAFRAVSAYLGICENDVVLNFSTFATDFGFYSVLIPILLGGTAVISTRSGSNPREIPSMIERCNVTAIHIFPPTLVDLLSVPDLNTFPTTGIRYMLSSGQQLPVRDIARLRAIWPEVKVFSSYGMTECKRVTYLPPEQIDIRPASVGKAIPGVRTYLIDDDENLIRNAGMTGELAVSGELVMAGYWNMPEENERRFRFDVFGESRVFLTGDLFRMDEEGYLYYVARKDDVFSRNMFKVNPREVEEHLRLLPDIVDVAVVPVPDARQGVVPRACVVLNPGSSLTADGVIEHCVAGLDWQMIPAQVVFMAALPRTESGKIATRCLSADIPLMQ
ncbi:class I adenylate-forming enzyme family protein [Paraburkholderia sp. J67]|uniref:class I adenylate-forming enzyme family protein n=1 Tax=Paraburkholderia sp. J67 TaxID=2805435 RepID=UPI002ABD4957|nr:class I adenylate-forming enzyme family protein [Paraburkholderia sp. J67]